MDIGGRLKMVREQRGLSQRELAQRAGLTNGAISLIEQNKSSPSVASLKRLLDAIPMTLSEFFAVVENESARKFFFTPDEFVELSPKDLGFGAKAWVSLRQVGDVAGRALQVLHEVYAPGADTGPDLLSHDSEEAGVVVRGIVEVTVGECVRVLNPGDGYYFDSRIPHRFRNIGESECEIVSACTPPSF